MGVNLTRGFKTAALVIAVMSTEELFAVDPDDIPLLIATGVIAVGCVLLITGLGDGHPLVSVLVVGGTIAFVVLTIERASTVDSWTVGAAVSMILGSALVSIEFQLAFEFGGPIGATLFLFGAIVLARRLDE